MLLTICIIILGAAALIGLIVGLFRGVTRAKTWAMDLALTSAVVIPVSRVINFNNVYVDTSVIIGTCLFVLLVFTMISAIVKSALEEHCAPLDKIFGGLVLAVKGFSIAAIILSLLLCFVDLTNISALYSACSSVLDSGFWALVKPYIFDYLVIAFMLFIIKEGYKTGIMGAVWFIIRLALYLGALFLAYWLAFNVSAFVSAAESLAANLGFLNTMGEYTQSLISSLDGVFFAKCIITLGLAILLLIVVKIFTFIISRILDSLKENSPSYSVVDSVLGSIMMYVIFMGILLAIGAFLYTLTDVSFMSTLNEYLCGGGIASVFYSENALSTLSFFENLNLANYLK